MPFGKKAEKKKSHHKTIDREGWKQPPIGSKGGGKSGGEEFGRRLYCAKGGKKEKRAVIFTLRKKGMLGVEKQKHQLHWELGGSISSPCNKRGKGPQVESEKKKKGEEKIQAVLWEGEAFYLLSIYSERGGGGN